MLRLLEPLGRPLEAEVADGVAEDAVGGLEDGPGGAGAVEQIAAHAHLLRALAWEEPGQPLLSHGSLRHCAKARYSGSSGLPMTIASRPL